MKRVIAVVTARAGSKRFPNKNNELINGHSLVEHSIIEALKSKTISSVVLTSDDKIALNSVRLIPDSRLVCYDRPKFLASDTAKTIDVLIDVLQFLQEDANTTVMLLQPTSPLRTVDDIEKALKIFFEDKASSLASVTKTKSKGIKFPVIINKAGFISQKTKTREQSFVHNSQEIFELNGAYI